MVIVYWYIVNNKVVERFWGFLKPKKHNSEVLAECIKEQLAQHTGDQCCV
jgi:wobble nucleotide-excising tRNase